MTLVGKRQKYVIQLIVIFLLLLFCRTIQAQWVSCGLSGVMVKSVIVCPSNTGGIEIFAAAVPGGVLLSTDAGQSWNPRNNGLAALNVGCLCKVGTCLLAGVYGGGIYRSTDDGMSWTMTLKVGESSSVSWCFLVNPDSVGGSKVYSGCWWEGMFVSKDSGATWDSASSGLGSPYGRMVNSLAVNSNGLMAAATGDFVYLSSDNGAQWRPTNLGWGEECVAFSLDGTDIYAGTGGGGFWYSRDDGESWTMSYAVSATNPGNFQALLVVPDGTPKGCLFAADWGNGVLRSTTRGRTWVQLNQGLPDLHLVSLAISPEGSGTRSLFAGGDGLWMCPLNTLTGARTEQDQVPGEFTLGQNYPNPFNPSTRIKYTVGGTKVRGRGAGEVGAGGSGLGTRVKLAVYDVLGREVTVLVDEQQAAGEHQVTFDATGLSTGVYFYRLTAGDFTETKRMMLVK